MKIAARNGKKGNISEDALIKRQIIGGVVMSVTVLLLIEVLFISYHNIL